MEAISLPKFDREFKKLVKKVQDRVKKEIKAILNKPDIGELKRGDLANVRVHKFNERNKLYLLAYEADSKENRLYLYTIGVHEGFYKRLKRYLKEIE